MVKVNTNMLVHWVQQNHTNRVGLQTANQPVGNVAALFQKQLSATIPPCSFLTQALNAGGLVVPCSSERLYDFPLDSLTECGWSIGEKITLMRQMEAPPIKPGDIVRSVIAGIGTMVSIAVNPVGAMVYDLVVWSQLGCRDNGQRPLLSCKMRQEERELAELYGGTTIEIFTPAIP